MNRTTTTANGMDRAGFRPLAHGQPHSRALTGLVAVVALAVSWILLTPGGAQAATSRPSSVHVSQNHTAVYTGSKVTLSVRAYPAGRRSYVIQNWTGTRWVTFTSGKTSTRGIVARTVKFSTVGAKKVRIVVGRYGRYRSAVSRTVSWRVVTASKITATATPAPVTPVGSVMVVTGAVFPHTTGRTVALQGVNRSTGRWVTLATTRTASSGTYRLRRAVTGTVGTSLTFRVYVVGSTTRASATSPQWFVALVRPNPEDSVVAASVVKYVNVEHQKVNGNTLAVSDVETADAQRHSIAMRDGGYIFHGDWTHGLGQNVGATYYLDETADTMAKRIVMAWMESPGHKAQIVREDTKALGVGVAHNADGAYFFTLNVE